MLKNNKLLIDENCPMCTLYGSCFTKMGLVDDKTADPYQNISVVYSNNIDMHRAKNEIALHNPDTQQTVYGIDAIIEIISHKHSFLNKMLTQSLVYWSLTRLYRFISYNRKIIYPSVHTQIQERDCTPDTNPTYRWLYIIFVALFTGVIINNFTSKIISLTGFQDHIWRELAICFGQIAWQWVAISYLNKGKRLDYLGTMSTVSFMGAIAVGFLLLLNWIIPINSLILLGVFTTIVALMFVEHIRRCKILHLPLTLSLSWVSYRVVVLMLILIPSIL